MALTETTPNAPLGAVTIYRITETLAAALDIFRRRNATVELQAFSPAQLEDIGLSVADYADAETERTGLVGWITERIANARTAAELGRLSPRQLDDIGLTMADVDRLHQDARFF